MKDDIESVLLKIKAILSDKNSGMEDVEPLFIKFDDIISHFDNNTMNIVDMLVSLFERGDIPIELFWFMMHKYKYGKFSQYLTERYFSCSDLRTKRAAESILEASSENWDGREMFYSFSDPN